MIQQVACFQLQSLALVEQAGKQAAEPMPAAGRLGLGKLQEPASNAQHSLFPYLAPCFLLNALVLWVSLMLLLNYKAHFKASASQTCWVAGGGCHYSTV